MSSAGNALFRITRGVKCPQFQMPSLKAVTVPPLAGYALGYQVVQAYLERSGRSVVEAALVPATELIAESRHFA